MADNKEGEEAASRGNEWEVVSLTESAYAATSGPKQVALNDNDQSNLVGQDGAETSSAMFMSGHFVFPPSQHENLPLEAEYTEIHKEQKVEDAAPKLVAEVGDRSDTKDDENWNTEGLNVSDEFTGIPFFDEKGNRLSVGGTEFEESTALEGLHLVEKGESLYSTAKFSSFHGEAAMGVSTTAEENTVITEPIEPSEQDLDPDMSNLPQPIDKDYNGAELPCEAWWKRRATALYTHAKEANAFWSVFIAAAFLGLVILGQQWQRERWQVLQLKRQFGISDERMGRMMGPIARLKDVVVGGNRRGSFIRGSTSTEG